MDEAQDEGQREQARASILSAVIAGAPAILKAERVRACYFKIERADDGSVAGLRYVRSGGRADEPRTVFEAGHPVGDGAIQMVLNDEVIFCDDTDTNPPASWTDHPHNYRTFLSVPVRGQKQVFGMLSVDAPNPGDLSIESDAPILTVLARILAVSQIARNLG
jgi:GAF domain-containing protein